MNIHISSFSRFYFSYQLRDDRPRYLCLQVFYHQKRKIGGAFYLKPIVTFKFQPILSFDILPSEQIIKEMLLLLQSENAAWLLSVNSKKA